MKTFISTVVFMLGMGIALHDYAHTLWEVGGYSEILSVQGGYIGFILMFIAYVMLLPKKVIYDGVREAIMPSKDEATSE